MIVAPKPRPSDPRGDEQHAVGGSWMIDQQAADREQGHGTHVGAESCLQDALERPAPRQTGTKARGENGQHDLRDEHHPVA